MIADHSHLNVQVGFLFDALERIHLTGFNSDDISIIEKVIDYLNLELKNHNQLEENHLLQSETKLSSQKFINNFDC